MKALIDRASDIRNFPRSSFVALFGLLAAALGLTALIGWFTGQTLLAAFLPDTIPMAPSAALFFLCYGLGSPFFLLKVEPGRPARLAAFALGSLGLLAAGLLFILSLRGIRLDIEHLGFSIAGTAAGSPIGHMSPLTAFCFILAGAAFLLALPARSRLLWPLTAAFWCASSVSLFSLALLLAYLLGAPLLYGSAVIPPALPSALAMFSLALSMQLAIWLRLTARKKRGEQNQRPSPLLLVFSLLAAGIILTGYLFYQKHEKEYGLGMKQQLMTVVKLKTGRIADWLGERRADAMGLTGNLPFAREVEKLLYQGGAAERANIAFYLERLGSSHGYDGLTLLNGDDRPVLQQGSQVALSAPVKEAIARARASGISAECDLFRNQEGKITLLWAAPISAGGEHGKKHLATLLLSVRAETFLFPFIEEWPTASRSAETLLVRRNGNEALFLNNLRFNRDAALKLSIPLSKKEIPAVQAVLGREGIFEGRDYRGVPVMAAIKAVPGSPWFLVARMDISEIQAPMRDRLWGTVLVILVLLAGAGAAFILQWQLQRQDLLLREAENDHLLAAELEKRVAERTAQLDSANKELESFSYSVSHDLKAPLRGIDGYSRLLEEDYRERLDAEGRKFLDNIRQGVAQMHQLIEDLLAYSRMERRSPENLPLNLPGLIRKAAAEVETELAGRGGALKMEVPDLLLSADREGLNMALRNLLDNARKFSREANPASIEIGARTENGKALIWVRDNGIGFDQKFHERIFEIFHRLVRAEDFPGTGVGLALVRKAMQRMGGRVWAESAPGKGAIFYLELPLAKPGAREEENRRPETT